MPKFQRRKAIRFNPAPKGLPDIQDAMEEFGVVERSATASQLKKDIESKKRRIDKHLAKYLYQLENGMNLQAFIARVGVPHGYGGAIRRVNRSFTVYATNGTTSGFLGIWAMPHQGGSNSLTSNARLIMCHNTLATNLDTTTLWDYANVGPGALAAQRTLIYEDANVTPEMQQTGTVIVPQRCVSYNIKITPIGAVSTRQGVITLGETPMHQQTSGFKKTTLGERWQQENHELSVAQMTEGAQISWHPKWEEEFEYTPRFFGQAAMADPNVVAGTQAHFNNGPASWAPASDARVYAPQLYIFGEGLGAGAPFLIQLEYVYEVARANLGYNTTGGFNAGAEENETIQDNTHPHTKAAVLGLDTRSGERNTAHTSEAAHKRGKAAAEASAAYAQATPTPPPYVASPSTGVARGRSRAVKPKKRKNFHI